MFAIIESVVAEFMLDRGVIMGGFVRLSRSADVTSLLRFRHLHIEQLSVDWIYQAKKNSMVPLVVEFVMTSFCSYH